MPRIRIEQIKKDFWRIQEYYYERHENEQGISWPRMITWKFIDRIRVELWNRKFTTTVFLAPEVGIWLVTGIGIWHFFDIVAFIWHSVPVHAWLIILPSLYLAYALKWWEPLQMALWQHVIFAYVKEPHSEVYSIKSAVLTMIWRLSRTALALGWTWLVFQAIDRRIGAIVLDTYVLLKPAIIISAGYYLAQPFVSWFVNLWGDRFTGVLAVVYIVVFVLYVWFGTSICRYYTVTVSSHEYTVAESTVSVPQMQVEKSDTQRSTTWKDVVFSIVAVSGFAALLAGIMYVLYLLWDHFLLKLIGKAVDTPIAQSVKKSVVTYVTTIVDSAKERKWFAFWMTKWSVLGKLVMITPTLTTIAFCYIVGYRTYYEVILPDRAAAKALAASMVTTTPVPVIPTVTLTYTPASTETLTPLATVTPVVPTSTFTPTFTAVPNTPTATFTVTATDTLEPTATWTAQPGIAVTQDMTLPEAISPDALVPNCGGAEQGSSFVISVDPDKGYCIPGLTPYNVGGARYNIGDKMYVVAIAVTNEAAWYYLDGNFPFETTTCALNGEVFTGGRNNFVTIKNENTDSRLSCTFTDANGTEITITGTAWK